MFKVYPTKQQYSREAEHFDGFTRVKSPRARHHQGVQGIGTCQHQTLHYFIDLYDSPDTGETRKCAYILADGHCIELGEETNNLKRSNFLG